MFTSRYDCFFLFLFFISFHRYVMLNEEIAFPISGDEVDTRVRLEPKLGNILLSDSESPKA